MNHYFSLDKLEVCTQPKRRRIMDQGTEYHIPHTLRMHLVSHYQGWRNPIPLMVLHLMNGSIGAVIMLNPAYKQDVAKSIRINDRIRVGRVLDAQLLFSWLGDDWEETRNSDLRLCEFDLEYYDDQTEKIQFDPQYPIIHVTLKEGDQWDSIEVETLYDFYVLRRLGKYNPQLTPPPITWELKWVNQIKKQGLW